MSEPTVHAPTGSGAGGAAPRQFWLVHSTPVDGLSDDALAVALPQHMAWLSDLERRGRVLLSGPLLSGPGTSPGSGVTVLRAETEQDAEGLASQDPFFRGGLRTFTIHRWRINEGSLSVTLELGSETLTWR